MAKSAEGDGVTEETEADAEAEAESEAEAGVNPAPTPVGEGLAPSLPSESEAEAGANPAPTPVGEGLAPSLPPESDAKPTDELEAETKAEPEAEPQPEAAPNEPEREPFRDGWFFDNPIVGRAIRYTFAEKRLARAVFVNALLLVVMLAVVQELFGRVQLGLFHEKISYGRVAFLGVALVEALVVSLLGPISFLNLFEAERREECFDQVVTTGVSPHRIVFGRLFATLGFLSVVVFSSLPFFAITVVLDGASALDVLRVYFVLGAYALALTSLTAAVTVGFDDTALPIVIAILAVVVVGATGFNRRGPPEFAAWSPIRHVVLDYNDIVQGLRLGSFRPPRPYGLEVPCTILSLAYYGVLTFLGLAYTYVGPDLELGTGLDSFDSVSVSRKAEATQARRGVARTLLRSVQLRFFYENLGPRARALSPLLRATTTVVIFTAAHTVVLGALWPDTAPSNIHTVENRTAYPYLGFCMLTLCLLALSAGGARSALLARTPVQLGIARIGRFPTLFLLFGLATLVPPLVHGLATHLTGYPPEMMRPPAFAGLYALAAGYAAFLFAVGLLMAMVTTNPYSATGWSFIVAFAANLTPAVWIPLYTGNIAGEGSSWLLDLSPVAAAYAIAKPGQTVTFSRFEDDERVRFLYEPSWEPCAAFIAVAGVSCLVAGIAFALRERRENAARHQEAAQ